MTEINPDAPPEDDTALPAPSKPKTKAKRARAWREGDLAVVSLDHAVLPKRCVLCNEPGDLIRRQFLWHPEWVYVTVSIGIVMYFVVAYFTHKSPTVDHALCEAHQLRRRNGQILLYGGPIGGIVLLILGGIASTKPMVVLGMIVMIGSVIAGVILSRTLSPYKVDNHHAWLLVGRPFLDSLPHREED